MGIGIVQEKLPISEIFALKRAAIALILMNFTVYIGV